MTVFHLSPSSIARCFHHDCDRYLRYHATPVPERAGLGIPVVDPADDVVNRAILEAGVRWEEYVVGNILSGKILIPEGTGPVHERKFSLEQTMEALSELEAGQAIFQPSLFVPPGFLKKYGLTSDLCVFNICYPDIIRCQNGPDGNVLQVLDIKANESVKTSHRVQTALYALMMQYLFRDSSLNVDMDNAGIWLLNRTEPEIFDLRFNIKVVEDFLIHRVPQILKTPLEDVCWHVRSKCKMCEFYDHCRNEATEKSSLSMIPSLSPMACRHLNSSEVAVSTLDEMDRLLGESRADDVLKSCGSLRNRGNWLRRTIKALLEGDVLLHGGVSTSLPLEEDVRVFMNFQVDPVTNNVYALGFLREGCEQLYGSPSKNAVYMVSDRQDCGRVVYSFLLELYNELSVLDEYNKKVSDADKKSLQVYVFDPYELEIFNSILQDTYTDGGDTSFIFREMLYFQNPALCEKDMHPSVNIAHPVVVLVNEINRMLSLPIPFQLHFNEVVEVFSDGVASPHMPDRTFWSDVDNSMRFDAIYQVLDEGMTGLIPEIKDQLEKRLNATAFVLEKLRVHTEHVLVSKAQKFFFPEAEPFNHPELSRISFITRYESYSAARSMRQLRSRSFEDRVREGISVPIEFMGLNIWKLVEPIDSALFEQYETFSYLIVPEDLNGDRVQMSFEDYRYRASFNPPGDIDLGFVKIEEKKVDPADGMLKLLFLEVSRSIDYGPFNKGDRMVLHPRFTDFTSGRLLRNLSRMDGEGEGDLIRLIRDPVAFATPLDDLLSNGADLVCNSDFTPSQKKAFLHLLNNRLTLVWGPPGTGKTHFLARSIICMIRSCSAAGVPLRIGIVAFTHSAIENILVKVQTMLEEGAFGEELHVYKLGSCRTPSGKRMLRSVAEVRSHEVVDLPYLVLGGTVYSFDKIRTYRDSFDVLVVDEASQMKFSELSLGMGLLSGFGRLVLAGDDMQLPPIISGEYPETEDGLPGLQDSVFTYLRRRDDPQVPVYICQLLENWRMNSTLSAFPARTVYGEGFRPANEDISSRKIRLKTDLTCFMVNEKERKFLDRVLDPNYPLVVCLLEDVLACVENVVEARLVAGITGKLRNCLVAGEDTYPQDADGDAAFWRDGLFIISPHHAQIRIIKEELAKIYDWQYPPFVDTVDRMQGQESQVSLISYGVSDPETALNEAEFIYSLNRLNVSITRGRSKCIIFLPRPLLEPHLDVLENETASKGLHHMFDLIEFCKKNGDIERIAIDFIDGGPAGDLTVIRARSE